jgi:hypothetical protein
LKPQESSKRGDQKLTTARVDTERLVRDFLDAFNSLKTMPETATCSSPNKEEEQGPQQSQDDHSKAFEPVGGGQSTTSADPSPVSSGPLGTLTGEISDIDEAEPEQISAFEGAGNSEPSGYQKEAPKNRHEIIQEFCADDEVLERLRVTPEELRALSRVSMLGVLTSKREILCMLRQIRKPRNPAELRTTVPSEPPPVPEKKVEPSIPDLSEMAERIRREALARLRESYSLNAAEGRGATWRRIKMMLNWRNHSSPNY